MSDETREPTVYELMEGTDAEKNLADDFVGAINKMSALTGALEGGTWPYAIEKIGDLRRALDEVESRLSYAIEDGADGHRVEQLITAFAQSYGGHLGPKLYPVEALENAAAREKIAQDKEWQKKFRAAMSSGDEAAASELTGGKVRIVDGMTGDGGR